MNQIDKDESVSSDHEFHVRTFTIFRYLTRQFVFHVFHIWLKLARAMEKSGTPCASSNHLGVQVIQSQKAWAIWRCKLLCIRMGLLATTCASQWHAECQGLSKQIPLDHPVTHPPVTQLIWWFGSPKQFTFKVGSLWAPWPTTACQGWMNCGSCSLAKQSKKCQLSRIYDQGPCLTYWWWVIGESLVVIPSFFNKIVA